MRACSARVIIIIAPKCQLNNIQYTARIGEII